MPDRAVEDRAAGPEDGAGGRDYFSVEWQLSATLHRVPSTSTKTTTLVDLTVLHDRWRLDGLYRLDLLDRPPKQNLDRLVRLASDLLDAPIALLTLVDQDRQFFLAAHGLPDELAAARQTTLDYSLCQYTVASGRPLIVGDTRADPLLAGHPAVRDMGVLAYAGMPLIDPQGRVFGTFCVVDLQVRDWDDHQLAILARLAQIATEICAPNQLSSGFDEAGHVVSLDH